MIIKGKTKDGFSYAFDEKRLRNARMWEIIDGDDSGGTSAVRVPKLLLGDDGKEKLYKFLEDEDGCVDLGKVDQIIGEILVDASEKSNTAKNSKSSPQ